MGVGRGFRRPPGAGKWLVSDCRRGHGAAYFRLIKSRKATRLKPDIWDKANFICLRCRDKALNCSRRMPDLPTRNHLREIAGVIERIATLYRQIPDWFGRDVVIPFAATRLALCLVGWLAFYLFRLPITFPQAWQVGADGNQHLVTTISGDLHPLVNMWSRWDTGWYLEIAKSGYSYRPGYPSSVAFFPLYPLLIRAVHTILHLPSTDYWFLVSGIVTSNICLIAALIYFYKILTIDFSKNVASRANLYLLIFPTSFFLSSVYAESLFLALVLSAFFYARTNRWIVACILAALAALCRSQVIVIGVPLLVEYLQQRNFNVRQIKWNVLAFAFIPAALIGFVFYLYVKFGSWSLIFDVQQAWGRRLMWPWHTLSWVLAHAPALGANHHEWIDLGFLTLLLVAAVVGLYLLRPCYSLYLWFSVLFLSSWGMLGSVPRFDVVVFPLFIVMAILGTRSYAFHVAYVIMASMMAALFMILHSQWNWVA